MTEAELDDVILRLKRVEGQIKGIQKMMEDGRPCREVLTQIMAARSSLDQVGVQVFQREIAECLKSERGHDDAEVRHLQETIRLWSRFS